MKKILCSTLIIVFVSFSLFSQGVKEESSPYVASTSWCVSFAYVGGLDNVKSIAPSTLTHPPEYEIVPSDIQTIQNSEAFIYAGYETMMKTLSNNLINEEITLQITTGNSLDNIKKQAEKISTKYNSEEKSKARVEKIEDLFKMARAQIEEKKLNKVDSYVHFHQVSFAKSLGLNVVGSFGPNGVSPKHIEEVSKLDSPLIIDNIHNPIAAPLKEVNSGATLVVWRNFPNTNEDESLYNMLKDNIDLLLKEF